MYAATRLWTARSSCGKIYNDTVENFFQGDRKALKELADAAERLAMTSSEHHKYDILPTLYKMPSRSLDLRYPFVQALEHLNEATQSLSQFSESIFTYVDNNHTPFTIDQVDDLKEVHTALIKLLDEYCKMLQTGTYIQFDYTMVAQEQLSSTGGKSHQAPDQAGPAQPDAHPFLPALSEHA